MPTVTLETDYTTRDADGNPVRHAAGSKVNVSAEDLGRYPRLDANHPDNRAARVGVVSREMRREMRRAMSDRDDTKLRTLLGAGQPEPEAKAGKGKAGK